ncbi:MAG: ribose-phosphate pyrophosphokinase [Bdellovibrionales bacterium]|nr:ribose-phosphate pyrophosphokinase [Bdellovibrionales bacterium]
MNRQLLVFSGRSNPRLTAAVCDGLGIDIGRLEVLRFSDGELSIEINENVRGRDVFFIQSISAPGNDHLMELLIAIDAFRRASAWRVTAVIPYFGYARQDRKLRPRVPITAKLVANLITVAGAGRVLTIDLHSGQIMGFFDTPVDNLNAMPVMLPYVMERYGTDNITIVSPDAGGVERARLFAQRLGEAPLAIIDKRRSGPNQVAEMKVVGEVEGRTCIIIDDMIDTGGTLIKAGDTLLEEGAKQIIAACVHPVFSGKAVERLTESAFQEVIVTDTISRPGGYGSKKITSLSVAPLFAEAIRRIHSDDSISSLFK